MVQNLTNNHNGRAIANQFVIRTKKSLYFQSYSSVVAKITTKGTLHLSNFWDYSQTTVRNLYIFLRQNGFSEYCDRKSMEAAIDSKVVKLHKDSSLTIC